jgi:hypothetical protein
MIDAQDDLRHDLAGVTRGRESLLWHAFVPEHGIGCAAYAWMTGEGEAGSILMISGPDWDTPEVCEIRRGENVDARDFDAGWSGPGIDVRHVELLHAATVSYASDRAQLNLSFEGTHPAFDYGSNRHGCPPFSAQNRFEQTGRVVGELTIGGRSLAIDGMGHRNHSWGPRDVNPVHHWTWLAAAAGADLSLQCQWALVAGEVVVNGYVARDGENSPLVDATFDVSYDDALRQERFEGTLVDEQGRTVDVAGSVYALLRLELGVVALGQGACECTIDGRPGAGHLEVMWPQAYLRTVLDPARGIGV